MAMINQDAIERAAEASALRVLVQTVSMLVFEQSGLSPDRVRALGRTFASEIGSVTVPGADAEAVTAIRTANAGAIQALFDGVADAMRNGDETTAAG